MSLSIHQQTLSIHNCELYLRTAGSGPPPILLRGFTDSGTSWEPFIGPLAREYTEMFLHTALAFLHGGREE